jgi:hypothetical protein
MVHRRLRAAAVAGASSGTARTCGRRDMLYLTKATIVCGGSAFLIYSFPVISQVAIIGLLTLLWLSCAHRTINHLRRR